MNHVIARADRGEPLHRVVLRTVGGKAVLSHPDRLADVEAGRVGPVGFPAEDVFPFDRALFDRLRAEWDKNGSTPAGLWPDADGAP